MAEPIKTEALHNVVKLSITVVITMALALVLRMYLPRILGPEGLGTFYFAESFSMLFFAVLPLGLATYITKEVSPRREHATEILSSVLVFQLMFSLIIGAIMFFTLKLMNYDELSLKTGVIMAGYSAAFIIRYQVLRRVFLAIDNINFVSFLEIGMKIVLLVSALLVLSLAPSVTNVALCFFCSEVIGCLVMLYQSLRLKILPGPLNVSILKNVIVISFPYFLSNVFMQIYSNIDAAMLSKIAGNTEVGYYGASVRLQGILLFLAPIINNALQPVLAKAIKSSEEDFKQLVLDSFDFLIGCSLPLCFCLMIIGDVIARLLYGPGFEYSYRTICYLAPALVLTYLNVFLSTSLNVSTLGKGVAMVMFLGTIIKVLLNIIFIPLGLDMFGEGGGGVGSGLATVFTETAIFLFLVYNIGAGQIRNSLFVKTSIGLFPCVLIIFFYDQIIVFHPLWRLIGLAAFVPSYLFATRLIRIKDLMGIFLLMRKRRTI